MGEEIRVVAAPPSLMASGRQNFGSKVMTKTLVSGAPDTVSYLTFYDHPNFPSVWVMIIRGGYLSQFVQACFTVWSVPAQMPPTLDLRMIQPYIERLARGRVGAIRRRLVPCKHRSPNFSWNVSLAVY